MLLLVDGGVAVGAGLGVGVVIAVGVGPGVGVEPVGGGAPPPGGVTGGVLPPPPPPHALSMRLASAKAAGASFRKNRGSTGTPLLTRFSIRAG